MPKTIREFFVSPRGHDAEAGTLARPWRSLARASRHNFQPGDRLLLEGGVSHEGSLILSDVHGEAEHPVFLSSYGAGRARILAGADGGVLLRNCSGVTLSSLEVIGAGYPRNRAHGVCLFADAGETSFEGVRLEDLEVSGFGCAGVAVGGKGESGFRGLRLSGIDAHDNAYAGIFVWGGPLGHQDLTLQRCLAHGNHGIEGLRHPAGHGIHSGHGILLTSVDGALVEHCRAFDNGARNTANSCGPAGIWASISRRVLIRRNESFRNRTAGATDGGGFGLDGGSTDCALEENYSHDNDGPGLLLAQFYGASRFARNRIVGNRSENDARRNDNGAIHVWGPMNDFLEDVLIQGNVVKLSDSPNGRPRALAVHGATRDLRILDNSFLAAGVALQLEVLPHQQGLVCFGNSFAPGSPILWQGTFFEEVGRWLELVPQGNTPEFLGKDALQAGKRAGRLAAKTLAGAYR